jgi:glucokinase
MARDKNILVGDVGGIAQKIQKFLAQSDFRARFESKGRMSPFVQAIPTKLILNADAALLGAARAGMVLGDRTKTIHRVGRP